MEPSRVIAAACEKAAAVRAKAREKTEHVKQAAKFDNLMRKRIAEMAERGQDPSQLVLVLDFKPWFELLQPWADLHPTVLRQELPRCHPLFDPGYEWIVQGRL